MLIKTIRVYKLLSRSLKRSLIFSVLLSVLVAFLDVVSIYIVYEITKVFTNLTTIYDVLGIGSTSVLYSLIIMFFTFHCLAKLVLIYQTQRSAYLSGWWLGRAGFNNLISSNFESELDFESATTSLVHRSSSVVQLIIFPLLNVIASLISIIIIMAYLMSLSALFVLAFFFLLLSAYVFVYSLLLPVMQKTGLEMTKKLESTLSIIKDAPSFLAEVKLYNLGEKAVENYSKEDLSLRHAQIIAQFVGSVTRPVIENFALLGIILYLLLAFNNENVAQSQDLSLFITVLFGSLRLIPYLQNLYVATSSVKTSQALLDDFLKLFDSVEIGKKTIIQKLSKIRVEDATVNHLNNSFKHDFEFNSGTRYMILGPSGSGKSSLLKDICQVGYRGTKVIFNGEKYINPDLASVVSYVPQKSFLYTGTLLDNLTLGDENVDSKRLENALLLSKCDEFLESVDPSTLGNISLSSSKDIFSGGQLKRFAIARALYRNTDWLVLDEATSGLDSVLEIEIVKNITSHSNSIIFVTHNQALSVYFDETLDLSEL